MRQRTDAERASGAPCSSPGLPEGEKVDSGNSSMMQETSQIPPADTKIIEGLTDDSIRAPPAAHNDSASALAQQPGLESQQTAETKPGVVDEEAATIEQARLHISHIRTAKGLDQPSGELGENALDLQAALRILSDQLYSKSTHFLLELIQNADDNAYTADILPTITFHPTPGKLLIACNEAGFQPKNVDALCRIGRSTKSDRGKGFIGEKEIGFKSVFKLANIVTISSSAYTFKFDRDAMLGIIAPIWLESCELRLPGWTQFQLLLSQGKNDTKDKKDMSEKELRVTGIRHSVSIGWKLKFCEKKGIEQKAVGDIL